MKKALDTFIVIFLSIIILLTIWGVVIEPRLFDIQEETAVMPNLPTQFGNKNFASFTDWNAARK